MTVSINLEQQKELLADSIKDFTWSSGMMKGRGTLRFQSLFVFHGVWVGEIIGELKEQSKLIISKDSKITGLIVADSLRVSGHCVDVLIKAKFVHIKKDAYISGNIEYTHLQIDEGASVEARLSKVAFKGF